MKKERMLEIFKLVWFPALVTALGVILVVDPDSATALVTKLIGWVLVIVGAGKAISLATHRSSGTAGSWILAAAAIILGVVLLSKPLILARWLGRILGVILIFVGAGDLRGAVHQKAKILAIVTLVVGIVLLVLPMTLTRTLLRLCGIVVAVIGVVNLLEKLQEMKLLDSGAKNGIIDADE